MKKIILAALLIMVCAACASAAFNSKKGVIPDAETISYRGIKITDSGVSLVLVNKGEHDVEFQAAVTFLTEKRVEIGDFYIEKTVIPAGESVVFKDIYLKGDPKSCRKAASLRWTVYAFNEK